MYHISNSIDNDDVRILDQLGSFTVIGYQRDLSVMPSDVTTAYFSVAMNARKHQVVCDLSKADITLQTDVVQRIAGNVNTITGIKGVGDLSGRTVRGKVTDESAIKPEYVGDGAVVLEPIYRHIILSDLVGWNGPIVLGDGLFLACGSNLKHKAVMRLDPSPAVADREGLFNLGINDNGVLYLEFPCPREELVEIALDSDVLKIDGNMTIAWSDSLNFVVECSGKSLIGPAASEEGLVNIYHGADKALLTPVAK